MLMKGRKAKLINVTYIVLFLLFSLLSTVLFTIEIFVPF